MKSRSKSATSSFNLGFPPLVSGILPALGHSMNMFIPAITFDNKSEYDKTHKLLLDLSKMYQAKEKNQYNRYCLIGRWAKPKRLERLWNAYDKTRSMSRLAEQILNEFEKKSSVHME